MKISHMELGMESVARVTGPLYSQWRSSQSMLSTFQPRSHDCHRSRSSQGASSSTSYSMRSSSYLGCVKQTLIQAAKHPTAGFRVAVTCPAPAQPASISPIKQPLWMSCLCASKFLLRRQVPPPWTSMATQYRSLNDSQPKIPRYPCPPSQCYFDIPEPQDSIQVAAILILNCRCRCCDCNVSLSTT